MGEEFYWAELKEKIAEKLLYLEVVVLGKARRLDRRRSEAVRVLRLDERRVVLDEVHEGGPVMGAELRLPGEALMALWTLERKMSHDAATTVNTEAGWGLADTSR